VVLLILQLCVDELSSPIAVSVNTALEDTNFVNVHLNASNSEHNLLNKHLNYKV
jgi:hypothetical protein